jgi:hypothetical protein
MAFESDPRPMAHGRRRSVAARARHDNHGGLRSVERGVARGGRIRRHSTDVRTSAIPDQPGVVGRAAQFASPLPIERRRPWFMHSGVLAFAAGGLVAAAAAGLFGALHGAHSASVDTSSHSAPSPAPAAAPTNPASTPATQTKPATPTHSVMGRRGSFCSTSHQTTPQHPTSSSSGQHANDQQWQSNHDSVSTPPTWNRNDYYWFTHRRDHDDSRWTRDHDSDDYSSGDHGDNSWSSRDQSSDNHSRSSDDNASK